MRPILIAVLIIAVGFGLFLALSPKAPSDLESAKIGDATTTAPAATTTAPAESGKQVSLTSFNFTGYGPGKEHVGTFKEAAVSGVTLNDAGVPTAGRFTIKTASVSTGIEALDKHLCSADFFDCAAHPEIVFDLKSITTASIPAGGTPVVGANQFTVSGDLTFNGVTKSFSFPVTVKSTANADFAADFKFDTTFFNFKYTAIDKEVRIQFEGTVK